MVQIKPYSKETWAPSEQRFVVYVGDDPALMVEFSGHEYQIYGPRRSTPRELLINAVGTAMDELYLFPPAPGRPFLPRGPARDVVDMASLYCLDRDGKEFGFELNTSNLLREPDPEGFPQSFPYLIDQQGLDQVLQKMPDHPSYMTVSRRANFLWGDIDIEDSREPRSGFAAKAPLTRSYLAILRMLASPVPRVGMLERKDAEAIQSFVNGNLGALGGQNV
jgi:hypothetical protein